MAGKEARGVGQAWCGATRISVENGRPYGRVCGVAGGGRYTYTRPPPVAPTSTTIWAAVFNPLRGKGNALRSNAQGTVGVPNADLRETPYQAQ